MRRLFLTLATASALVLGGAAQAQATHPLRVANASGLRAGADMESESQLRGTGKWIIGAVVLALLIWGAIELLDNDDEAFPVSP